jgi:membrane protein
MEYFRRRILPLKLVQLVLKTGLKWQQDNCSAMAAALAYYALFSLFPTLLVILSVLGSLFGSNIQAVQQIREIAQQYLPSQAYVLVNTTFESLSRTSTGAGLIGTVLLLYSASTVFNVLHHSVDRIWRANNSKKKSDSLKQSVFTYLVKRLTAFTFVFGTALLLLVSMASQLVIETLLKVVETFDLTEFNLQILEKWSLADTLQMGSSFLILGLVNLILLKLLPSTQVNWKDIWPGALLSTTLYVGLHSLVTSSVITFGSRYLYYGVIGSVMILLMWIYLTCQIFLIGCEFSYTYTYLFGSRKCRAQIDN